MEEKLVSFAVLKCETLVIVHFFMAPVSTRAE